MYRKNKGFTLVELMIVVVIIGILAAIAISSYQEYARKSRRAQCQSEMLSAAGRLERQYSVTNKYPGSTTPSIATVANLTGCPGGTPGDPAVNPFYNVTYVSNDQTFTITATPAGVQVDDKCGNLTLTNLGQKGANGSTSSDVVTKCWR